MGASIPSSLQETAVSSDLLLEDFFSKSCGHTVLIAITHAEITMGITPSNKAFSLIQIRNTDTDHTVMQGVHGVSSADAFWTFRHYSS